MTELIIKLKDVHKSYYLDNGEEVRVLKGVTLDVKKGEFIALMGESGSGKTTLLNVIGCLHYLSSGNYYFNGEDIGKVRDENILAFIRRKKIGFIFQQFNLFPRMTALKNVELPGVYNKITSNERSRIAMGLLKDLGMGDRFFHVPGELSGGQQQRVAIARSMMNDPEILLADEPTGALDSKNGLEVMNLFSKLKNQGKTIIMVTHTAEVARHADRIIFMKDGVVIDTDYNLKSNY